MAESSTEEYLTSTEAAARLQVSERTLERIRNRGEIEYVKRDRGRARPRIFYRPEAISAYLRSNEPQVVPAATEQAG